MSRIHLIGVAGSGMSGIAGLCISLGHHVSGSDKVASVETARLQTLGLDFATPTNSEKVRDSALVIYSSAIKPGHPDFDAAKKLGLPMVRRQVLAMLHRLLRLCSSGSGNSPRQEYSQLAKQKHRSRYL